MQQYIEIYREWKEKVNRDSELCNELIAIGSDINEIEERFHKDLEFGTGGMRGIIGAGTNRMNIFTVRKASRGLAAHINKVYPDSDKSVVIAYDSRYKSKEFAVETALVLIRNGIKAYIFEEITPTPILSYAVVELQAKAGVVITASHNPKEYNGYKVYWDHGGQVTDERAHAITEEINNIANVFAIDAADRQKAEQDGNLIWIKDEILDKYLKKTAELVINKELLAYAPELKIVYTPLHGTGLIPFNRLFKDIGFTGVSLVKEQTEANPAFPTVVCPNPEDTAACTLAVKLAGEVSADIILASDPDADRIGLTVKNKEGRYISLTGNQTGALLVDYIIGMKYKMGVLPANGIIIKTIVTSEMGAAVGREYGISHLDLLTGFKYIGEKVAEYSKTKSHTFLFGYEESFGYLIGSFVRDKDAVQTSLLIAEMALYYKKKGIDLSERLEQLYEKHGYFKEDLVNISLTGVKGQERIKRIMDYFRENPPDVINKNMLKVIKDYLGGKEINRLLRKEETINLPRSNVLQYFMDNGSWCCIRPSGTEPKLKLYFGVRGKSAIDANQQLDGMKNDVLKIIDTVE